MANEAGKKTAACAAAERIQNGMTVGLGTGSTAAFFLEALAARLASGELIGMRGVPTSRRAEEQARSLGIPLLVLTLESRPDVTVDGADEIDPRLNLIKGGGGALVQEKIVAVSSREMWVVADQGKMVEALGEFPLPVAVVPFGWDTTLHRLEDSFAVPCDLRRSPDGSPYITDDGLHIVDMRFGRIENPSDLQWRLRTVAGVAEVGLFVNVAGRVFLGRDDGTVEERTA